MNAIAEKNKLISKTAKQVSVKLAKERGLNWKQRRELYEKTYAEMLKVLFTDSEH